MTMDLFIIYDKYFPWLFDGSYYFENSVAYGDYWLPGTDLMDNGIVVPVWLGSFMIVR